MGMGLTNGLFETERRKLKNLKYLEDESHELYQEKITATDEYMVWLNDHGATITAIANTMGLARQTVSKRIAKYRSTNGNRTGQEIHGS